MSVEEMTSSPEVVRLWRIGRKAGRTIYVQLGSEPSDDDYLIGVMDTRDLAEETVRAHNDRLSGDAPASCPYCDRVATTAISLRWHISRCDKRTLQQDRLWS